ncbi:hypothetical protein MKUB_34560 [Mycobacterium kubicae]|uniref:Uncharacterized protein n=1 Tax=Mycobacterium kubicae TaxID=120959 RepID=A0ABQ1BQL2_9MYCO|nr:hypothetical protein MKUB_34560 [Mycobacterium kubicae]
MEDGVEIGAYRVNHRRIANVLPDKAIARPVGHSVRRAGQAGGQVVNHYDFDIRVEQTTAQVTAQEPGATRDKDAR